MDPVGDYDKIMAVLVTIDEHSHARCRRFAKDPFELVVIAFNFVSHYIYI